MDAAFTFWVSGALVLWLAAALVSAWLMRNARRDPRIGLALLAIRLYARVVQRVEVEGAEHVPHGYMVGPLVVVANHTSGVDPMLVQSAARFEIRWLMARDMMSPRWARLWEWMRVIPVNRAGGDATAARQALRYMADGDEETGIPGVIGVFPEGRIGPREGAVLPFEPGVGLLVHKSGGRVLQAIIEGTVRGQTVWGNLLSRGRARVRFLPIKDYSGSGMRAAEIAADLHARLIAETGWERVEAGSPDAPN